MLENSKLPVIASFYTRFLNQTNYRLNL